jgi:hypothetical protein
MYRFILRESRFDSTAVPRHNAVWRLTTRVIFPCRRILLTRYVVELSDKDLFTYIYVYSNQHTFPIWKCHVSCCIPLHQACPASRSHTQKQLSALLFNVLTTNKGEINGVIRTGPCPYIFARICRLCSPFSSVSREGSVWFVKLA